MSSYSRARFRARRKAALKWVVRHSGWMTIFYVLMAPLGVVLLIMGLSALGIALVGLGMVAAIVITLITERAQTRLAEIEAEDDKIIAQSLGISEDISGRAKLDKEFERLAREVSKVEVKVR